MIAGGTYAHLEPIWYHLEHSDFPYYPKQFPDCDFFCRFLKLNFSLPNILKPIYKYAHTHIGFMAEVLLYPIIL